MIKGRRWASLLVLLVAFALIAAACGDDEGTTTTAGDGGAVTTTAGDGGAVTTTSGGDMMAPEDFQIGMILVGPQTDRGWSQAHYEAGLYVLEQLGLPEENLIVLDKMNTADRPETTIPDVVADMIDQGADVIFATSDDMKDGIEEAAADFPVG